MSSRQIAAAKAAAPLNSASGATQVFAQLLGAALAAVLPVPGSGRLEARRFVVRASGVVTGGAAGVTAAPFIAAGSSLTSGSNTALATVTAATVGAASTPWSIELSLIFDSTSGKLNGSFSSLVNGASQATGAIATVLTGLNGQTEPVLNLVAGVTFSSAAATNTATLQEFCLEG